MRVKTSSPEETAELGARLASVVKPGDSIRLEGRLGTGKTLFVRGLARGLGYGGHVRSPSFTIINLYPEIRLCHVDAYRLESPDELVNAGVEEYLDDWICAFEWADKVRLVLPEGSLLLRLEFADGDNERDILILPYGDWGRRLKRIFPGMGIGEGD